jgi:hypothetical protein
MLIDCSWPDFSSRAETDNNPLTSNWKVTLIFGIPFGAEGIPFNLKIPKLLLSFANCLSPCKTWISTVSCESAPVENTSDCLTGIDAFLFST